MSLEIPEKNQNSNKQQNCIMYLLLQNLLLWQNINLNLFFTNNNTVNPFGNCLPGTVTPVSIQDGVYHGTSIDFIFIIRRTLCHFDIFPRRNGPSVTVQQIFEFVPCLINLCRVLNECNLNGGCTTCTAIQCTCRTFTDLNAGLKKYSYLHD